MTKSAVHAVLAPVLIGLLLSGCGSKDADLTDTPDSADTGGPLTDVDADGYSASEDCDDTNRAINCYCRRGGQGDDSLSPNTYNGMG